MTDRIPAVSLGLLLLVLTAAGQTVRTNAPGGPGLDAQWASAGKQGVGTSASLTSKVWFTLQGGALTEVYYPNVAVGNVHLLQFVVVDPETGKVETERDDARHEILVPRNDALTFQQVNTARSGKWKITKTYVADIARDTVLIDVRYEGEPGHLYVYYDPSLANSGMHDTARTRDGALLAGDKDKHSALVAGGRGGKSTGFTETANGFLGVNDGLTLLRKRSKVKYDLAENGNVVQFARIPGDKAGSGADSARAFTLALGFGASGDEALTNARRSLAKGFDKARAEYEREWSEYVGKIRRVDPQYQAQFNMAAMQLKAHEDKTYRGANIASLSVPWGGGDNANEDNVGGYHLVWSRDLYQVFTAYMALGDRGAAERALDFLLKVQQKPDGSFPQNSWLDGRPFWGSLQHDEVAYPLIMAYQLGQNDRETYEKHLKPAADFIVRTGPATPQERWEEESGYSPSTIAAEIAGLVCAAEIARKNGDAESAEKYLRTADEWAANIEKWTVTTNGKYGDGNYYLRITQQGRPDAGDKIELNNGAGEFDEREIVDAGFLELVRLGIKPPDDPLILKSVAVIDKVIRVETPNGEAFYRYNNDGYGEMDDGRRWNWDGKYTGKGRLWAFLSGERGQFELALANHLRRDPADRERLEMSPEQLLKKAEARLKAMAAFANEGLMIPEQVWDKKEVPEADSQFSPNLEFGEGTGSATPLAWSMAQFIRLAVNLKEGANLDTPDIVRERYASKGKAPTAGTEDKPALPRPEAAGPCERAEALRPKGSFVLTEPQNSSAFPRLVAGRRGKEASNVMFAYFGTGKDVELAGDFTGWRPCGLKFQEFGAAKMLILKVPDTARFEYKLIVDGEWILDPLNPSKLDNGVGGENSFYEMPGYEPSRWIGKSNTSPVTQEVSELEIDSEKFGKRTVKVYLPSLYFKRGIAPKLPVLYLQDGTDYINRARAIDVLENLTAAGKVEPFMIVFIDPKDRMKEYWANSDWADFIAREVVPAVEQKYAGAIAPGRDNRALLGASLGGVTSVWAALRHPDVFSRVGGQSSSFWIDEGRVVNELGRLKGNEDFVFYFDDGTFEGSEDSRSVVELLRSKGFDVTYEEAETGHNWTSWRDRLAEAFMALMK